MWTISIHMEDKWQHKLNIAKWKSKDARSEIKALNKQTGKKGTNSHCDSSAIWDSYLPASRTFPKADLHICMAVAHSSLAPGWLFFPLRNLGIREVYPNGSKFLPTCGSVHQQLPFATCSGGTQGRAAVMPLFPQCRINLFYHGPKSAAPNLTIALLALLVNFCNFLSTRHKDWDPLAPMSSWIQGIGHYLSFFGHLLQDHYQY